MRKIKYLAGALAALMLSGCAQQTDRRSEAPEKERYYQVLDADGAEVGTIAAPAEVEALEAHINSIISGEAVPQGEGESAPMYTYVLWQEETLRAGEDPDAERDCLKALTLSVQAESDTVVLELLPDGTRTMADLAESLLPQAGGERLEGLLSFCYEASPEAAAALRSPSDFLPD